MSLKSFVKQGELLVKENSTTIFTSVGVAGTVVTAVLTGKASFKAHELLLVENARLRNESEGRRGVEDLTTLERVRIVGPEYIPAVGAGAVTITSIIMAHRISSAKIATLAAAYGLSESRFQEYKEKVLEKFGENKATEVQDEAAQARVKNTEGAEVVILGDGTVLCFDQFTGRFFESTAETIKRAENRVNEELLQCGRCSLSLFYDNLELDRTTMTDEMGWNTENTGMLDVIISSTISKDGRPCLAIDFSNAPITDYNKNYE